MACANNTIVRQSPPQRLPSENAIIHCRAEASTGYDWVPYPTIGTNNRRENAKLRASPRYRSDIIGAEGRLKCKFYHD